NPRHAAANDGSLQMLRLRSRAGAAPPNLWKLMLRAHQNVTEDATDDTKCSAMQRHGEIIGVTSVATSAAAQQRRRQQRCGKQRWVGNSRAERRRRRERLVEVGREEREVRQINVA